MAAFNLTDLPNPFTPMAFLPPVVAYQSQISAYVLIGTLGGFIWDVLCNTLNDYKLLFDYRLGVGTASYFVSRIATLLYILSSTMLQTYPAGSCLHLAKFTDVSCAIALAANSLLFFLRARAIFNRNKYLVLFFLLLWLTVAGTAIIPALPGVMTIANVGTTKYCMYIAAKTYTGLFTIPPVINDTVIFVAISWRMFSSSHVNNGFKGNFRALMSGEYLPGFSKAVLKDGQLYYLITVAANIPAAIMTYHASLAVAYRTMFFVCTVMITNCMACHVFRNTKFGFHRRIVTTTELTSRASGTIPMFRSPVNQTTQRTNATHTASTPQVEIVATREVMPGDSTQFEDKVAPI
ncbi:hypothetical protein DFH09DRAFT_1225893 [Mycena vulgaris]|nr:hypothetical protein DFH09DRAFT_1225893 [Mycena vulgaris]